MALDAVTKVTRASDGSSVSVTLTDADEDDRDVVLEALNDLGLVEYGSTEFGSSGVATVRARRQAPDDDVEDEQAESAAQSETVDEDDAEAADADETDEDAEGFACEDCGREFATGSALGGHRRYCEERDRGDLEDEQDVDDEDDVGAADVSTLEGIGPMKAADLRERGLETVRDVAEAHATTVMNRPLVGQKAAVYARHEARERLGLDADE